MHIPGFLLEVILRTSAMQGRRDVIWQLRKGHICLGALQGRSKGTVVMYPTLLTRRQRVSMLLS